MTPRNPSGGFPQLLLDVHEELIVDLFAGGGGASLGIEMATGRQVDVAVNHDPAAIAMHEANHPQTHHVQSDVFDVDPREVTRGRPVGLLWASPDCTYHSKARGGKPIRSAKRKRRSLAWVVTRWAGQVRPRVICLENVEEFAGWGPLVGPADQLRPCSRRRGKTFRAWVRSLERHGYVVEWRELRACDFGAPTIRKRLYLIARCDGGPIVWPEASHGPGTRRRYRAAAECIDWSIPMLSIFASREEARAWGKAHGIPSPRRPLADATMRRIARGVVRYVLEAPRPFLVPVQNASGNGVHDAGEPLHTITAHPKGGGFALAAPFLVPRYGERDGQEPRSRSAGLPYPVVVPTGNGASLVAGFLAKHYGGVVGSDLREPKGTVTSIDHDGVVTVHMEKHHGVHASSASVDRDGGDFRDTDGRGVEARQPQRPPNASAETVGDRREDRLPGRAGQPGGEGLHAERSPSRLDGAAGADPGRDGGEPHRRREGEQSPGEPGVGHAEGECVPFPEDRVHSSERIPQGEVGADPGSGPSAPQGGSFVPGDRGETERQPDNSLPRAASRVASFIQAYYGQGIGQSPEDPTLTIPTKDRLGLITVQIRGEPYLLVDIAMRMLQPRELYRAQGFPDHYRIDQGPAGKRLTKTEQVHMVGNSVPPRVAAAIVAANCAELVARDEALPRRFA